MKFIHEEGNNTETCAGPWACSPPQKTTATNTNLLAGEIAQWVKAFAWKHDDLGSISGVHVLEGEPSNYKSCPLTAPCAPWHAHDPLPTSPSQAQINKLGSK